MFEHYIAWNPINHIAWANTLGLIATPLFGPDRHADLPGVFTVLQDGRMASFTICSIEGEDALLDSPISWAWSANLNHALVVSENQGLMYLRRWDAPETIRRFKLPSQAKGATELLQLIEKASPPPPGSDVIWHALRTFRRLRNIICDETGLDSIRAFNTFIAGAEFVRLGVIDENEWNGCQTIDDIIRVIGNEASEICGGNLLPAAIKQVRIDEMPSAFLCSSADTGIRLEPDLLLRHAAGQLYQEAHLIIEKEAQLRLPGMPVEDTLRGILKRDVRFTPITLARSLTQEAIKALGIDVRDCETFEILDPACGSGVFLQEALRELISIGFRGHIILRGFDLSPISCAMTSFCINRAKREAEALGIRVSVEIVEANALNADWGRPDIILMNPPFIPWQLQSMQERDITIHILDTVAKGRADISMAFIWKGVNSLRDGAVLVSVLPASLLESGSGIDWREGLAEKTIVHLIGHLRGYGYFRGSIVEPAFMLLQRRGRPEDIRPPIKIMLANEGSEDAALRALRCGILCNPADSKPSWEIIESSADSLPSSSWLPRSGRLQRLLSMVSSNGMPVVGDLFNVHQGIRTGMNKAFILHERDFTLLPDNEKVFFRPIASNTTIRNGYLHKNRYVFYPYGSEGLLITTEEELRNRVPIFYSSFLKKNKSALQSRAGISSDQWWILIRERQWQRTSNPKLVSKYFGESGGFAYDSTGDFVVLQGFAWLWKYENDDTVDFYDTDIPLVYLALLNSTVFEMLLDSVCPRFQGGQFDLSPRYVTKLPLPNMMNNTYIPSEVIRVLARLGYDIYSGKGISKDHLFEPAARAFGISTELLEDIAQFS